MKRILIIGAGRSTSAMIDYLEKQARKYSWNIVVADKNTEHLTHKVNEIISLSNFDIKDDLCREDEIKRADLVISMLPVRFHKFAAITCLKFSKSLLTASYEPAEWKEFEAELDEKGLLFLNEMGVDPGLDHMSAMKVINRLKAEGHELLGFETFTGGLVAPESDDNPWKYKISWNPRNVVLAGQDGPAKFRQEGKYKYIPYNRLFRRTEIIEIEGFGKFEGYANRDSLKYIEKYNLGNIPTIYRGTLRRPGFCRAWNVFVQLGATDDTFQIEGIGDMTWRDFINSFLYYHKSDSVETKLYHYMHIDQDSDIIEKLEWLGIFDNIPVGLKKATPAQVLEHLVKQKWQLKPDDKDMTVMWHKFIYSDVITNKIKQLTSSMAVIGENAEHTAMAKTVGLPLGIAAKLVLTGKIKLTGLQIPTIPEIYDPVLDELKNYGIHFNEKIQEWKNQDYHYH
ncbi:MAG: saccharopine dehydrogenase NADP-binding domain-containing protein [Prolixibacteraceae bacterium]|nr:saccharopine dehydrogenase NADP-binding domain-containing protein [Prolixibacteraceae bacterium]